MLSENVRPPSLASDVLAVVGHPEKKTFGAVTVDTRGTHLRLEECAPRASTSGPRRSAHLVNAGLHIRTGMHRLRSLQDRQRLRMPKRLRIRDVDS